MDSPCIKQTVCKVLKIFQYGKYLVAYVLKFKKSQSTNTYHKERKKVFEPMFVLESKRKDKSGFVVVDFLFIVTPIVGVCKCSMFCCTLLYVHSSIAIILMGKRELVVLLNMSSCILSCSTLFVKVKRIFRKNNTIFSENYYHMHNVLSQVYCINQEGGIHKYTKG